MSKILDRLAGYVQRYPVRVRAAGVVAIVLGYLIQQGHIEPTGAEVAYGIIATALGVKETERHTIPVPSGGKRRHAP